MPPDLPRGMAFQIYQAWLQGPSALFRLFEDTFGRQALYGPPDPDMQQRTIDSLSEHIGRLLAQVERLQAEVGELQGHHLRLQRVVFQKLLLGYNPAFFIITRPTHY